MSHLLRTMLIAAGIAGFSTIAAAGNAENGIELNGLADNGVELNALTDNALTDNALTDNAIAASGVSTAADGESVQGLFVIGIELPKH